MQGSPLTTNIYLTNIQTKIASSIKSFKFLIMEISSIASTKPIPYATLKIIEAYILMSALIYPWSNVSLQHNLLSITPTLY